MSEPQPIYTSCENCGEVDHHPEYHCPCACHQVASDKMALICRTILDRIQLPHELGTGSDRYQLRFSRNMDNPLRLPEDALMTIQVLHEIQMDSENVRLDEVARMELRVIFPEPQGD